MKPIRTAIMVTMFWTIVLGGMYPLLVSGIGAAAFPAKAYGSLTTRDGRVVGSRLIGQAFETDRYFHPRPSAIGYDSSNSGGSNLSWTSDSLKNAYEQRKADWQKANGPGEPPMDVLFASGSGLDPHISPRAAELQVPRVTAARHLAAGQGEALLRLVQVHVEEPQLGFLGEPRVNVLLLNLELDRQFPGESP